MPQMQRRNNPAGATAPMMITDSARHRFWSKVAIKQFGCYEWTATKGGGYGSFWLNGKNHTAHRFAYWDVIGPIPDGLEIANQFAYRPSGSTTAALIAMLAQHYCTIKNKHTCICRYL